MTVVVLALGARNEDSDCAAGSALFMNCLCSGGYPLSFVLMLTTFTVHYTNLRTFIIPQRWRILSLKDGIDWYRGCQGLRQYCLPGDLL